MRKIICRLRLSVVSRQWGVVQSCLQMLHVHVFLAAPLGARRVAKSGADQHQGRVPVRERPQHARASADGSLGSAARSRCWYGCASGARRENRSRSAFPQFRPHSRRSPPKQQHFRTFPPVAAQVDAVHVDVWIVPALQGSVPSVLDMNVGFLVQLYNSRT